MRATNCTYCGRFCDYLSSVEEVGNLSTGFPEEIAVCPNCKANAALEERRVSE